MTSDRYLDIRDLAEPPSESTACPVKACAANLSAVDSQWGPMPYCPEHRIRIHASTRTFVYNNGPDARSKRDAALRNILFERDYFRHYILGNAAKAESHRISHETSEDALTWNVFCCLAKAGKLKPLLSKFIQKPIAVEPELYLWGLKIDLDASSEPVFFPALLDAREEFEKGINKFLTEPDIMLYVPGQVLVLIEAKFTSGNTIASEKGGNAVAGEKPRTRQGLIQRYSPGVLPEVALMPPAHNEVFYSQLYRNLVFAIYMAEQLGVDWGLVSLVSETQCQLRQSRPEFRDPTPFIHSLLPERTHQRFSWYTWEKLYQDHVVGRPELLELAEYLANKSANGKKAFCC